MHVRSLAIALLFSAAGASAAAPKLPLPRIASNSDVQIWSSGAYDYDGAGNIAQIGNDVYRYDGVSRIRNATVAGHSQIFGYDAFGNMLSLTTDARTLIIPTDPLTNRVKPTAEGGTSAVATYDAGGNMLSWNGTYVYTWDGVNMMTSLTAPGQDEVYVYGVGDERLATVAMAHTVSPAWSWSLRDSGRVMRRFESSGATWTWKEDYIYREQSLLASVQPDGAKRHFHLDHLASPRVLTGDDGRIVSRRTFYPFGQEIAPASEDTERMKFTGHERDASLDYMHARYYAAPMGRFLSVDPIVDAKTAVHDPQIWNRYAYVADNPLSRLDPDGRVVQFFGTAEQRRRAYEILLQSIRPQDRQYVQLGADGKVAVTAHKGGGLALMRLEKLASKDTPMIRVQLGDSYMKKPGPGPVRPVSTPIQTGGGGVTLEPPLTVSGDREVYVDPRGSLRLNAPAEVVMAHELLGHEYGILFEHDGSERFAVQTENDVLRDLNRAPYRPVPKE